MKVMIKDKAKYFNITLNQEGNFFKNKNKELLLPELEASNSVFSTTFIITLDPPAVTEFIVIREATIAGAPIIINKPTTLGLVLGPGSFTSGRLPGPNADFINKFRTVLYRNIEVMKVPTAVTSTCSISIFTAGVSNASFPLLINSFILISPALPKGLFEAKVSFCLSAGDILFSQKLL
jgi:hypothetical protein